MTIEELSHLALQSRRAGHTVARITGSTTWDPESSLEALRDDTAALLAKEPVLAVSPVASAATANALADCLWSLLVVASEFGIDLDEAFRNRHDQVMTELATLTLSQTVAAVN